MLMEKEVEFSYKQTLATGSATISENVLDLGEYHVRSGYPAVVGDDSSATPPGQNVSTSYSFDGNAAKGATPERHTVGRGYYQINRKFGTKDFPFLGMINTEVSAAAGFTALKMEFKTHSAPVTQATAGAAAGTTGKVEASVIIPETSAEKIAAGTQIGWPALPRYFTNRYMFLRIVPLGAGGVEDPDGFTAGSITAAIVLAVPSF